MDVWSGCNDDDDDKGKNFTWHRITSHRIISYRVVRGRSCFTAFGVRVTSTRGGKILAHRLDLKVQRLIRSRIHI